MTPPNPLHTITVDDLARIWPGVSVVDVRGREEHYQACVPGSLSIPLDELLAGPTDLPDSTLYIMCGSGKRSIQAVRALTERGYSAVNVAGGITEWYRANHPVTYTQPSDQYLEPVRHRTLATLIDPFRRRLASYLGR